MTVHKVGGGSGKPRACLTLTEADTLRADLTHWQEVCYAHEAELQCFRAENARLRAALNTLLEITDKCKTMQIGAGGMSIEAQAYRTVYLRVPVWPFEEARAALAGEGEP